MPASMKSAVIEQIFVWIERTIRAFRSSPHADTYGTEFRSAVEELEIYQGFLPYITGSRTEQEALQMRLHALRMPPLPERLDQLIGKMINTIGTYDDTADSVPKTDVLSPQNPLGSGRTLETSSPVPAFISSAPRRERPPPRSLPARTTNNVRHHFPGKKP